MATSIGIGTLNDMATSTDTSSKIPIGTSIDMLTSKDMATSTDLTSESDNKLLSIYPNRMVNFINFINNYSCIGIQVSLPKNISYASLNHTDLKYFTGLQRERFEIIFNILQRFAPIEGSLSQKRRSGYNFA